MSSLKATLLIFFAAVAAVTVQVFALNLPMETQGLVRPSRDLSGWSPRPTSPSAAELVRRKLEARELLNVCAYYSDDGFEQSTTCGPNLYCVTNDNWGAFGCCYVDSAGDPVSDCILPTTCVDYQQSSTICGTNGCPLDYAIW